jgi:SagB-type dehydrogenase family enzyme
LLRQAFGCTPATGGRPHPSAGRLYPVSVLLALLPSRITGAPPVTVYHLRPIAGLLEPLANPSEADLATVAMDRASAASDDPLAVEHPAFFLVYAVHLDKAVARYRHRGYRFALLEAGAMCQQAELVAADLELGACLWGGFGDNELAALLGINPAVLLPLVVHFMGRPAAAAASAAADRRAGPPAAPPAAGGS